MKKHLLKTLVALLAIAAAAINPAWGQNSTLLTTITPTDQGTYDATTDGVVTVTINGDHDFAPPAGWHMSDNSSVTVSPQTGYVITRCVFIQKFMGEDEITQSPFTLVFDEEGHHDVVGGTMPYMDGVTSIEVYGYEVHKHTVQMADGTVDAEHWSISPAEATTTGIFSGNSVTATYSGDLKIKEVIATKHLGPQDTPLTLEALTDGTVVLEMFTGTGGAPTYQYSVNGGARQTYNGLDQTINVTAGDKIQFYGTNSKYNFQAFSGTADVKAYGNIMSLVNANGFATATTLPANNAFGSLFAGYAHLKDISGLLLPATTLSENCYASMFSNCTGLTTVPSDLLPATTLARGCYYGMFQDCENLTNAPALPATTLAESCYRSMFFNCAALAAVPATLPATTLAELCYDGMFYGCSSLTTAPVLPAATLLYRSYAGMFQGCSKLDSVVCMAVSGIDIEYSTNSWLDGAGTDQSVTTKTIVANPYILWPEGYKGIPEGWTRKNPDGSNWTVYNVPLTIEATYSGTVKVSNPELGMQYSLNCADKQYMVGNTDIPVQAGDKVLFFGNGTNTTHYGNDDSEGATRILCNNESKVYGNIMSLVDENNFVSATTLPEEYYIFANLFYENTGLTDASLLLLPATTLKEGCYKGMFSHCTQLTVAPALPATNLAPHCYQDMFNNCTHLVTVPDTLRATTLAESCYQGMFSNCGELATAPVLPALTLVENCYAGMFMDCPLLSSLTCLATDVSASGCTSNWLKRAGEMAQEWTFTADPNTAWAEPSVSGIPSFKHEPSWTRKNPDGTTFDYSSNLRSMVIDGVTIRYIPGETWAAAITNHPTENPNWSFIFEIGNDIVKYQGNTELILLGGQDQWSMVQVSSSDEITPDLQYTLDE